MPVYRRVLYYPAGRADVRRTPVPKGSRILSAVLRQGKPVVYVEEIPNDKEMQVLEALFVGTGQLFADFDLPFIGSIKDEALGLIWHVYGRII